MAGVLVIAMEEEDFCRLTTLKSNEMTLSNQFLAKTVQYT